MDPSEVEAGEDMDFAIALGRLIAEAAVELGIDEIPEKVIVTVSFGEEEDDPAISWDTFFSESSSENPEEGASDTE